MTLQRWLTRITSAAITVLVLACVSVRAQEGFGYIELDENTDPRFSMQHKNGDIGIIKPAGKRVFVNSQKIDKPIALRNNDYVYTKSNSAARIEFSDGKSVCQIIVTEFQEGNLYGDNGKCTHEVRTSHVTAQTSVGDTKYHISVSGKRTQITVLGGAISASVGANASNVVTINAGNDAVVTSKGIKGPNRVSDKKIRKRTKWRERYNFETGEVKGRTLLRDIAIGVGAAIILKEVYDHNKKDKNKRQPPDGNGNDDDTSGTRPEPNRPTIPSKNEPKYPEKNYPNSDSNDNELF